MLRLDRRKFLAIGVQAPLAALVARAAHGACTDPDELSDNALGMRESLEYTDTAPDPEQACGGCAFFNDGKVAGCGSCQILGDRIDVGGYCVSWTKA